MLSTSKLRLNYSVGDIIQARLIEQVDDVDWIVSVEGMLLRVANRTQKDIHEGQVVTLKVANLDPAKLVFATEN